MFEKGGWSETRRDEDADDSGESDARDAETSPVEPGDRIIAQRHLGLFRVQGHAAPAELAQFADTFASPLIRLRHPLPEGEGYLLWPARVVSAA
jgi:hypothetical protein